MHNSKHISLVVPIFPLPNLVLFPKTRVPLHIFEMRYRMMVADVLDDDRLITMVLLKEGWERNYYGNPDVYNIGCIGKIEQAEKLEDNQYNILLSGVTKVRIEKFVQDKPYRLAEVIPIEEAVISGQKLQKVHLVNLYKKFVIEISEKRVPGIDTLFSLSFNHLVNTIASTLNIPMPHKQALLELESVEERYNFVTAIIQQQIDTLSLRKGFPHLVPSEPESN